MGQASQLRSLGLGLTRLAGSPPAWQQQKARSFEVQATISLARIWRDERKPQQARELLAPVYGWFTEGFDTGDLKEAKALLDELA